MADQSSSNNSATMETSTTELPTTESSPSVPTYLSIDSNYLLIIGDGGQGGIAAGGVFLLNVALDGSPLSLNGNDGGEQQQSSVYSFGHTFK